MSNTDLKARIRNARKLACLSQQDLAKAIGVSDKAISAYEVGRSSPPLKILQKISEATEQPLHTFLDETSKPVKDPTLEILERIEKELITIRELMEEGRENDIA